MAICQLAWSWQRGFPNYEKNLQQGIDRPVGFSGRADYRRHKPEFFPEFACRQRIRVKQVFMYWGSDDEKKEPDQRFDCVMDFRDCAGMRGSEYACCTEYARYRLNKKENPSQPVRLRREQCSDGFAVSSAGQEAEPRTAAPLPHKRNPDLRKRKCCVTVLW